MRGGRAVTRPAIGPGPAALLALAGIGASLTLGVWRARSSVITAEAVDRIFDGAGPRLDYAGAAYARHAATRLCPRHHLALEKAHRCGPPRGLDRKSSRRGSSFRAHNGSRTPPDRRSVPGRWRNRRPAGHSRIAPERSSCRVRRPRRPQKPAPPSPPGVPASSRQPRVPGALTRPPTQKNAVPAKMPQVFCSVDGAVNPRMHRSVVSTRHRAQLPHIRREIGRARVH